MVLWLLMCLATNGLEARLAELIADEEIEYGVAFRDLETGEEVLLGADTTMHAASTMKVPVMMRLFQKIDRGELSLEDQIEIRNAFSSIVDGSSYQITVDSDEALYTRLGQKATVEELIVLMIQRSSNLATNLLIDTADPVETTELMRTFGARDIQVRRGVEDIKAFERGLNNQSTARDMLNVMAACATAPTFSERSREKMLEILRGQEHVDLIPAGLPEGSGAVIANKTGSISRVVHDCAHVLLPGGRQYILVVFTRFTPNDEAQRARAKETIRAVSRAVYRHVTAS